MVTYLVLYNYLLLLLGCPSIVRSDCGTENTSLAACQMALRHYHQDDFKVFGLDLLPLIL